jgi:hypothetical protein
MQSSRPLISLSSASFLFRNIQVYSSRCMRVEQEYNKSYSGPIVVYSRNIKEQYKHAYPQKIATKACIFTKDFEFRSKKPNRAAEE